MLTKSAPEVVATKTKNGARKLRGLWRAPGLAPSLIVGGVVALPLWGLMRAPGPPMEEGFMLVFPEQILNGQIPNKDFLHLYGPGSLWVLAGFFKVFGIDIWTERIVGLLQIGGLVVGTAMVGYRWNRWVAAVCGSITAIILLPPIQLTALAWVGGMALAFWAVFVAVRVLDDDHKGERTLIWAGLLAGAALLYRPDLVIALGLPFGALWLWALNRTQRKQLLFATTVATVIPYLLHALLAGPGNAFRGMVTEPIFDLRPGRRLPFPPPTDELTSFLNKAFALRESPLPFPAPSQPMQVFIWSLLLFAACGALLLFALRARRAGSPEGWRLLALALLSIGFLPQSIQRADTAHLAWVSCVPFALLVPASLEWLRLGQRSVRWRIVAAAVPLAVMTFLLPQYTVGWWVDYTQQSFGQERDDYSRITNKGRSFFYGRSDVAAAAHQMFEDIDRATKPGQRLIVATSDLRRTAYSEAWIYFMLPQLEVGTRYIEMDPGVSDAEDSELPDEILEADVVILSSVYDNWNEPNESTKQGSDKPAIALMSAFCPYKTYGDHHVQWDEPTQPIYELYLRC